MGVPFWAFGIIVGDGDYKPSCFEALPGTHNTCKLTSQEEQFFLVWWFRSSMGSNQNRSVEAPESLPKSLIMEASTIQIQSLC